MSLSIVVPARNEPYLQNTIDDLFAKAEGAIEVIAILDGYWPKPALKSRKNLVIIHHGKVLGMRASINAGAAIAKNDYLMKCDAHCAFGRGFDVKLKAGCEDNWTIVPRRYVLDVEKWDKTDKYYEFEYIERGSLKGRKWPEYADRVKGLEICDLMTFQGSCWFMARQRFCDMGYLDEDNFAGMGREAQEVCLKSWADGRCVLTRRTWYAHWNKPKEHVIRNPEKNKSVAAIQKQFPEEKLIPLIKKFWPVPSWEPEFECPASPFLFLSGEDVPENQSSTQNNDQEVIVESEDLHEYIKNNYQSEISNPGILIKDMTRAGLYKLFAARGFNTGCEIGVQRARNAKVMLDNIPDLNLFLVEPYKDHPSNWRKWGEKNHRKFKKQAHARLEGQKVVWLEGFSEEVSHEIPDESMDFVYIDGEHSYNFAMIDIILWSRKVRQGGIVSGHDYEYWKSYQAKVARAVRDYAAAYGIERIYMTDKSVYEDRGDANPSWFWIKK